MQQTYIMIKPDGVQRGLVGEIIKRLCVGAARPSPAAYRSSARLLTRPPPPPPRSRFSLAARPRATCSRP
jgi:hypothetical protein